MDMIFANANLEDQGVLLDYSFDECYGVNENNFSCKVQKYNDAVTGNNGVEPITQDFILYVEFTEYGGIIDRIESDTKTGVITFSGRTWHGVMNSYVIEPPQGNMYRVYDGEANGVLEQMISDIGMSNLFVVDIIPVADRGSIEICAFEVRYEKMYDSLVRMLKAYDAKLLMYYYNGKVHLGITLAVNYATNEEFDSSQVPFKVGYTYNNVNHLICLGQGDGADRAVIHLFMDDGEVIQPYSLVEFPKQDSDYILDKRNQVMFGKDEKTEVYDASNSEIITNYLLVADLTGGKKPVDWNGAFNTKYYKLEVDENGEASYSLFPLIYRDEYKLQKTPPGDWAISRGFTDYFYWDALKDPQYYRWRAEDQVWVKCNEGDEGAVLKAGGMASVKALSEAQASKEYKPAGGMQTAPADWAKNYSKYYQPNGQQWQTVSGYSYDTYGIDGTEENPNGSALSAAPLDWTWNFGKYYTRQYISATSSYVYTAVQGKTEYKFTKISKSSIKTSEWRSTWTNYYVKANAAIKKNANITKYKGSYVTARDAYSQGQLPKDGNNDYPKYKKGTYYSVETTTVAPDFSKPKYNSSTNKWVAASVYEKFSHNRAPDFVAGRYYYLEVHDIPTWEPGKYYTKTEGVKQIPTFDPENAYYAVQDRMAVLVKNGKEKMKDMCDNSSLSVNLELESNYDVLDVIGSMDEVTKISVNKPILRKVIKIKKDVLSIEYEVD